MGKLKKEMKAMKKQTMLILALTAMIEAPSIAQSEEFISPEKAQAAVRAFTGNPQIEMKEPRMDEGKQGGRPCYNIATPKGDRYTVDARTGLVVRAYYGSIPMPDSPQNQAPAGTSLPRLTEIAHQLALRHYPPFTKKQMVLHDPYWDGYTYSFDYQEKLPNGAVTANRCTINLLPDGRVYSYGQNVVEVPPETSEAPRLSSQQAVEIARVASELLEVTEVKRTVLFYKEGRLQWSVDIFGPGVNGFYGGKNVHVDARTGKVTEIEAFELIGWPVGVSSHVTLDSILLKKQAGPLLEKGNLWVSEDVFKVLGGHVREAQGKTVVEGDGETSLDCETIQSPDGQRFLPVDLLKSAFPGFVLVVEKDEGRRAINIVCADKQGLSWFLDRGQKVEMPKSLDPGRHEQVVERINALSLAASPEELQSEFGLKGARGRSGAIPRTLVPVAVAVVFIAALIWLIGGKRRLHKHHE
jgi:hypothetical protein